MIYVHVVGFCGADRGRLDFLVNVAGVLHRNVPIHDLSVEDYDRVLDVNLKGSFLFYKAVASSMVKAGAGGSIVNISSTGGFRPVASAGAYVASKHGLLGLTKTAALELAAHGIRVNAVCPGVTDTPLYRATSSGAAAESMSKQIPMQRLARPEEIANAVSWLLSDQASYVTGVVLPVDGGVSLI